MAGIFASSEEWRGLKPRAAPRASIVRFDGPPPRRASRKVRPMASAWRRAGAMQTSERSGHV
jgi:hypothetical protein